MDIPTAAAREMLLCARGRNLYSRYTMLYLPRDENLGVELSTDPAWFYLRTPDGESAVWEAIWHEAVPHADPDPRDPEPYDEVMHQECGTFFDLRSRIEALLAEPRLRGSVDVQINEWAVHYLLPNLTPAPECVRTRCLGCGIEIPDPARRMWWRGTEGPYHPVCLNALHKRMES